MSNQFERFVPILDDTPLNSFVLAMHFYATGLAASGQPEYAEAIREQIRIFRAAQHADEPRVRVMHENTLYDLRWNHETFAIIRTLRMDPLKNYYLCPFQKTWEVLSPYILPAKHLGEGEPEDVELKKRRNNENAG